MRSLPRVLALAIVCCAQPALAETIRTNSTLDAVTVYPQGAEVTRVANVKIPAGAHSVVLKDLPAALVPDSIRVQGEATGALQIGAVDTRQLYLSEQENAEFAASERKRLEDELEALGDKRQMLADQQAAAEAQRTLMMNLAGLPGLPPPGESAGGSRTPAEWAEIFGLIGEKVAIADKTIQEARVAIRAVDRRIQEVQNELAKSPSREDLRTELTVHLSADSELEGTLRIRYQVPAAYWQPLYDARLETGDKKEPPKLQLVRRAVIAQSSGEDWSDVALSLSTTRPQAGTSAPEIGTVVVDFEPEVKPLAKARRKAVSESEGAAYDQAPSGGLLSAAPEAAMKMDEPAVVAADERGAEVINTAFQAVYLVPERQTIRTGEGEKRVQIDVRSFDPTLTVRAVPQREATAYLYARLTLENGTFILPGPVSLFRDGVFVGRGALPEIAGGEEHELGFGVDDLVRIKFAALDHTTGETGIISSSRTETRQFKLTVRNLHERAIDVRVLDHVPVAADQQIEVELLSASTKPSVTNVEDKRGVLAWDLKLEPDEEHDITLAYRLSWPKEKTVRYMEQW
ncbi:MAG: mucoidy inhibitor MuiA family protein [Hyphomicrobiaceae bacterium]